MKKGKNKKLKGLWKPKLTSFEKKWYIFFLISLIVILIPFPFFYTKTYWPGPLGVPMFIWGWIIHGTITIIGMIIFFRKAIKKGLYPKDTKGDE